LNTVLSQPLLQRLPGVGWADSPPPCYRIGKYHFFGIGNKDAYADNFTVFKRSKVLRSLQLTGVAK